MSDGSFLQVAPGWHPWDHPVRRMWSLYEMLKKYAKLFVRLERYLAQTESYFHENPTVTANDTTKWGELMVAVEKHCELLGLKLSEKQVRRVTEKLKAGYANAILAKDLEELRNRIMDELDDRHFFYVSGEGASLYESEEPFGTPVSLKFGATTTDINEAAKCLALERYTAAVFHLMRVMEIGVQELGVKLGVANTTEKAWGVLTTEMDAALRQRYPRNMTPAQKEEQANYAQVLSHLNGVRIAWRNPTMHPKSSYTGDEAREVFGHAKSFMRDLASLL